MKFLLLVAVCLACAYTAGSANAASGSPASYKVRKGDSLGLISQRFGVTVNELRRTNGMTSDILQINQQIRIDKPFHRPRGSKVQWAKPCRRTGEVLRPFGPYKKKNIIMPSTGTDVTCAAGTAVSSPADGVVRHIGHMDGFGTLIIMEHAAGYATVLSPMDPSTLAVEVGHALLRGDHIGRTSLPPEKDTPPYLHIELRRNDKAIEPDLLLK